MEGSLANKSPTCAEDGKALISHTQALSLALNAHSENVLINPSGQRRDAVAAGFGVGSWKAPSLVTVLNVVLMWGRERESEWERENLLACGNEVPKPEREVTSTEKDL
ncbi:hypothetical protein J6590_023773 [Homalodisca vitripennis]|nr:hypothetical protein J6590_023773 [Homalodisca vitripennis]